MLTSDFDFQLPDELIAQSPVEPRDSARLMVINRAQRLLEHRNFFNLEDYLHPGDLVVWNNTKVFKARLRGRVLRDGAADAVPQNVVSTDRILNMPTIEVFLVRPMENKGVWQVLAKPGRKLRLGMKIQFASDFCGEVMLKEKDGTILMQFPDDDVTVRAKANRYGEVPTPPYIANPEASNLEARYQTVYAKHEGSVAAPTAGFHFTPELIERLKSKGVEFAEVTLHVGLGTFLPVKVERVEDHKMHSEWIELSAKNADLINTAKREQRCVVGVGTTTVRALESVAAKLGGKVGSFSGDSNIFITPGFHFQVIDALVTNFHLPKSTLLMLVSSFVGDREFALHCYAKAIEERYRFYSFGDAMFIY